MSGEPNIAPRAADALEPPSDRCEGEGSAACRGGCVRIMLALPGTLTLPSGATYASMSPAAPRAMGAPAAYAVPGRFNAHDGEDRGFSTTLKPTIAPAAGLRACVPPATVSKGAEASTWPHSLRGISRVITAAAMYSRIGSTMRKMTARALSPDCGPGLGSYCPRMFISTSVVYGICSTAYRRRFGPDHSSIQAKRSRA
eukprot:365747-Chlamydomonas_euryale.AAC.15